MSLTHTSTGERTTVNAAPTWERLEHGTADLDPPFAAVDLVAFDANARVMVAAQRRYADPGGQQVGALSRPASSRARAAGLRRDPGLHARRRRCGWPMAPSRSAGTSSSAIRPRTASPSADPRGVRGRPWLPSR